MAQGPVLKIGDFSFELPPKESMTFDMSRTIAKLKAPGGPPIYQDMGPDEKVNDFSGSIVGPGAWSVSEKIESLMASGAELQFSYGKIQKRVRVQKYTPKYIREDRVDYTIHLIVCWPAALIESLAAFPLSGGGGSSGGSTSTSNATGQTSTKTYTVKDGDTLWDIAARSDIYGDGTNWEAIAAENGITNEKELQIGQVLKIPASTSVSSVLDASGQAQITTLQRGAA